MENRIPVVWGIDRQYVLQPFVVMHSILLHSDKEYEFILLSADEIGEDIMPLEAGLREKYRNFTVTFIKVKPEFENVVLYSGHLSKAAFHRLLIAQYVTWHRKCIYLDCDVIVNGDLTQLYETDLDGYYIAGVKDCHIISDSSTNIEHQRMLKLPSRDHYINSGVMVMNLDKIREDGLTDRFLEQSRKENWNEDQDVLNVCCYCGIKLLPLKYNLFHFYLGENIRLLTKLPYEKEEFAFSWSDPFILHMGGVYKPWISRRFKGAAQWWSLAALFQDSIWYQRYDARCSDAVGTETDLSFFFRRCADAANIVIWGFTDNGRQVCDVLMANQIRNIVAFADNNQASWGKNYKHITVENMETVKRKYQDILWVISCRRAYDEVIRELRENGAASETIIRYLYNAKPKVYYLALDQAYYEREISDMALCEFVSQIPERDKRREYIRDIIAYPHKYPEEYQYLNEKYYLDVWKNLGASLG